MALYSSIEDELKHWVPGVSLGLAIESIAPSRDYIERNYIKKELGKEQYEALNAAYALSISDSPTQLSTEEADLLDAVMAALGPLSVWHFAGANAAEINDAGQRERKGEDGDTARLWISKLQRDSLFEQGMQELDNLLTFLDENKDDYPLWVAGTGYAGLKENLIQTTAQFNSCININGSRKFFKAMKPSIKTVEFLTIRRYIGPAFYARLVAGQKTGDLTNDEQSALDLLIPAVAHLAFGASKLPIEAGSDGIYITSSLSASIGAGMVNQSSPDVGSLSMLKREHTDTGMRYLNEATDYLNKTANSENLVEYFNSTLYTDPTKNDYGNLPDNDFQTVFAL